MRNRTIPAGQRGVALFAALIALVIVMLAAIALIRSTDVAQQISGNIAIKRDLTHESELALRDAVTLFNAGALDSETKRQSDNTAVGYYSTAQASNSYGVPTSLINAAPTSGETTAATGVTYRYMIDRMCPQTGSSFPAATKNCSVAQTSAHSTQSIDAYLPLQGGGTGAPTTTGDPVVYRISIRVTDARGAQSFFQATLSATNGSI
jgi:Tfp pilus assembly protein PilX